ncbi:hypothetical protein C4D60_Mb01t22160 [Musa balbisiana]|uniref:Protein SDA1 n=1 Tax=Musa balbisiana TaxID=52838 RepID=A0A4S8JQL3_MUSBA|nr:hypothetical protein C4D60_Mb01t22160 [Musa balbisiana]
MNEDLLQDLVLYKKSHEKAVSSAARSLITLFREICPSLLVKKDRGRPVNPKARPKAYGEVSIATDVPDIELLEHVDNSMTDTSDDNDEIKEEEKAKSKKRKFADYVGQLNTSESSLRALKRLTMAKMSQKASDETDGILSNEDFQRIKELKAKKEAKLVMVQQGLLRKGIDSKVSSFKIPSSEQLSIKPVDPAMLEVHIKRKLSKEERLALVRAGREDRGKYQARTAVKQKKMPLAAKRAKVARSRQEKKQRQRRSGKQFQGRKAWK